MFGHALLIISLAHCQLLIVHTKTALNVEDLYLLFKTSQ